MHLHGWWKLPALAALLAIAPGCCCGGDDGDDQDVAEDSTDAADADDTATEDTTGDDAADVLPDVEDTPPEEVDPGPCDGVTNVNCLQIQLGETMFYRRLDDYETQDIDDEGTTRTVVYLPDLIDEAVTPRPEDYRYKGYGTDGYTYGGFATWENVLNGYIELGNRRLYWDPSQMLPNSWNVRDTYLIVLSPAGG
ncbi:MAG: hypothetical protein GYA57_04690 [Myxococcales bacterium]|nr:hypothetical protein [Myxococcales bacterium]